MDSDLGYTRTAFKLDGGHIVECLLQALPVIKHLDVSKAGGPSLGYRNPKNFSYSFVQSGQRQ